MYIQQKMWHSQNPFIIFYWQGKGGRVNFCFKHEEWTCGPKTLKSWEHEYIFHSSGPGSMTASFPSRGCWLSTVTGIMVPVVIFRLWEVEQNHPGMVGLRGHPSHTRQPECVPGTVQHGEAKHTPAFLHSLYHWPLTEAIIRRPDLLGIMRQQVRGPCFKTSDSLLTVWPSPWNGSTLYFENRI